MLKAGYQYQPGDQIVTSGVVNRVEKELGKGGAGCTRRFQREAQIGAHPNLVRVIDRSQLADGIGEKGTPFLVMDRIHGLVAGGAVLVGITLAVVFWPHKNTTSAGLRMRPSISPWHLGIQGDF